MWFFFAFYTEIKMASKNGRSTIFLEKSPVDSPNTLQVKHFVEIAVSCTVSEINAFLHFTKKFKMVAKNGWKTIFEKSHQ